MAELLNNDKEFAAYLTENGFDPVTKPAAFIHGGQSDTQLQKIFDDYDAGRILNMIGSRIPIEGIDTTARNVFTPERWSELETIQVGGRVRDRQLCRIFTICQNRVERRKPVFYADLVGAPRITRKGAVQGTPIPLKFLQPSHPPIAPGLTIYNTPDEVATYIRSHEVDVQNKAIRYLGAAGMAKSLSAWRPELNFIYSRLASQHAALPATEAYCELGGIPIPRKFLKLIEVENKTEIVIRSDAVGIIRDVVGNYPEKNEEILTDGDIAAGLGRADGLAADDADYYSARFREIERAYAAPFLERKYGETRAKAAPLPALTEVGELSLPTRQIQLCLDEGTTRLGIHEDALAQLVAQREESAREWLFRDECADSLRVDPWNWAFADLWEKARENAIGHALVSVRIRDHTLRCAFRLNPASGRMDFAVHSSEVAWFATTLRDIRRQWQRDYIHITDAIHAELYDQIDRTSISPDKLMATGPPPRQLLPQTIDNWRVRAARSAKWELWEWAIRGVLRIAEYREKLSIDWPHSQHCPSLLF